MKVMCEAPTWRSRRLIVTEHGIAYKSRECATSRTMVSLTQSGETERDVSGSTANLESKDRGDNSLLLTRWLVEDMCANASQDPHDMGKTGLFETQSPIGATWPPSLPCLKAMPRCALVEARGQGNLFIVGGDR